MISVQGILDNAGIALNDEAHNRWTVNELIAWINDGSSSIVTYRPSAGAQVRTITSVEGALQTIPDDANTLIEVTRNVGGRGIHRADRKLIDDQDPDWLTATPTSEAINYMYDDRFPRQFYVYPVLSAGVELEAIVSVPPASVSAATDSVALDVQYRPALLSYVLYRALMKESEFGNANFAINHYQSFADAIGITTQMSMAVSPNQATP